MASKEIIDGAVHRDIKDYVQRFKFDFSSIGNSSYIERRDSAQIEPLCLVETEPHDLKIEVDKERTKH